MYSKWKLVNVGVETVAGDDCAGSVLHDTYCMFRATQTIPASLPPAFESDCSQKLHVSEANLSKGKDANHSRIKI